MYGYQEDIAFIGFGKQWIQSHGLVDLYLGLGFGVWMNRVNHHFGAIPSIVSQVGLRFGGSDFGFQAAINSYYGPIRVYDLISFTLWPLLSLEGGFYVAL